MLPPFLRRGPCWYEAIASRHISKHSIFNVILFIVSRPCHKVNRLCRYVREDGKVRIRRKYVGTSVRQLMHLYKKRIIRVNLVTCVTRMRCKSKHT